jgi:putative endonuclease
MVSNKKAYVYVLFNQRNGTLYTGVTSFLKRRVYEHKTKFHPDSFTAKYSVDKLGYYEEHNSIKEAIGREKQIKGGSRAAKLALIEGMNPGWEDLYDLL